TPSLTGKDKPVKEGVYDHFFFILCSLACKLSNICGQGNTWWLSAHCCQAVASSSTFSGSSAARSCCSVRSFGISYSSQCCCAFPFCHFITALKLPKRTALLPSCSQKMG